MYFRIALKNVRKSLKDYMIYFLTLIFAVCIFYSFNSIESQKAVLELSSSEAGFIDLINMFLSLISVFVVCILGGLIVYANNFLIKKRKKELGIYMLLGMGKNKISKILVLETFIVGMGALIVGLGLGVILSQALSVFTANLFEVGMTQFKFIFSLSAVIKTILYFGLIFLFVMIFNTFTISKYKLIDLLNASKKSQRMKVRNPILSFIIFMASIGVLLVAYVFVLKVGLNPNHLLFNLSIALGLLGTLGFFYGGASFLLTVISKNKNIYLKKLNIFVVRQINNNINTNFFSISLICLMLFVTIGVLSTGLSLKDSIENGIIAPFDASVRIYVNEEDEFKTLQDAMEYLKFDFKGNDYVFFDEYQLEGISLRELLLPYASEELKTLLNNGYWENVSAISISDYNAIRKLLGKEPITLNSNQVLVSSDFEKVKDTIERLLKDHPKIQIKGDTFGIANKQIISDATYNSIFAMNTLTLIVPDEVVAGLTPYTSYANVQYTQTNQEEAESYFKDFFNSFRSHGSKNGIFIMGITKQEIYESNRSLSSVVVYVGLYLGIVFLLSSAAVLALQQLSEASDSMDRYKSLRKIGVTQKMINKTIFVQTIIYFGVPLLLAIVHAIFGIYVVNRDLTSLYGQSDIFKSSVMTLIGIVIIYGGYFFITYSGYKSVIKNIK